MTKEHVESQDLTGYALLSAIINYDNFITMAFVSNNCNMLSFVTFTMTLISSH